MRCSDLLADQVGSFSADLLVWDSSFKTCKRRNSHKLLTSNTEGEKNKVYLLHVASSSSRFLTDNFHFDKTSV